MKNRKLTPPILTVLILSLLAHPSLRAQAQADTSTAPDSAPVVQPPTDGAQVPVVEQPAPATTSTASPVAVAPIPKHTIAYTVVKGDSLTSIAQKFNTTRKKLRDINNLTVNTLKPGQVLLVPSYKKKSKTVVAAQTSGARSIGIGESSTVGTTEKAYPVAKLVSPAEMAAEPPLESNAPVASKVTAPPSPRIPKTISTLTSSSKSTSKSVQVAATDVSASISNNPPAPRPPGRTLSQILGFDSPDTT